MTHKQIDAAREVRLWIGQVIVPTALAVTTVMTIPEVRQAVKERFSKSREGIKTKFKRVK